MFAVLASRISASAVKRDEGIIEGCKLCEAGKVAVFAGPDGKPVQILMRPEVIDKLLALWSASGDGAAHWTHRWVESGEDGLESKVATWKNFRKDDSGNLLADAHLWDTPRKNTILSAAEKDPKGIMVSQVFDYTGGRDDCNPISVLAADFVEKGAATTSLLAKLASTHRSIMAEETTPKVTLEDLKGICSTPEGKEMIRGAIEGHDKAADMAEDEAAAMEDESGVTDEDKKGEKQEPALMRSAVCFRRCTKAMLRKLKSLALNEAAILAKAKVQWEADFKGNLGNNKAILSGLIQEPDNDPVKRFVGKFSTEMAKPGMTQGTAIARCRKDALAAKDTSDLDAWEKAGRPLNIN